LAILRIAPVTCVRSGAGRSFPQMQVLGLGECGTHAVVAAEIVTAHPVMPAQKTRVGAWVASCHHQGRGCP
jgi:hypothetical protein